MFGTEAEEAAWYMENMKSEKVADRFAAEVYAEYVSMCAEAHRDPLPKTSFGRALCRAARVRSTPTRYAGSSVRVYRDIERPDKAPPMEVEGMPYHVWYSVAFSIVDEYIRAMRTFEGMTYEEVYREYSRWCSSLGHVPLPEPRFKALFSRAWSRAGGCTMVACVGGRTARVLHDPPEAAPGPTPS